MKRKTTTLVFLSILVSGITLAQPTPPHEVYGTVHEEGEPAEDVLVGAYSSGDLIKSVRTDIDGYYSLKIPSNYGFARIEVKDDSRKIKVTSASATEINFELERVEEQKPQPESTDSSGGAVAGGTAGAFPVPEKNQTSINNTEADANATSENDLADTGQEDTDAGLEDSTDGSPTSDNSTADNETSWNTENSITGLFSGTPSSFENFVTGVMETIISAVSGLIG